MTAECNSTPIQGLFELFSEPHNDHRGVFTNCFRKNEDLYQISWNDRQVNQVNLSRTNEIGTVRGLHLQAPPYSEAKIIRCLRGRIWDVAVDLRPHSSTFGQWHAVELSPKSNNAIIIPEGLAHGFQVLEPYSELLYLHSGAWEPKAETGVRFDDVTLAISWPLTPKGLSIRDLALPSLNAVYE